MNATDITNKAQDWENQAEDLTNQARKWQQRAGQTARQAWRSSDEFVHGNAWASVGIAVVVGCALGLLLARSRD